MIRSAEPQVRLCICSILRAPVSPGCPPGLRAGFRLGDAGSLPYPYTGISHQYPDSRNPLLRPGLRCKPYRQYPYAEQQQRPDPVFFGNPADRVYLNRSEGKRNPALFRKLIRYQLYRSKTETPVDFFSPGLSSRRNG